MKVPVTSEILSIIRTYSYRHDISISEFGRRAGISKAWISKLQNTDANLSLETATFLLNAAGYDLKVVKKGATASNQSGKIEKTAQVKSRLKKVVECQSI